LFAAHFITLENGEEGDKKTPLLAVDATQKKSRAAPAAKRRPQSRHRPTDQDSGAHAAAFHSGQGAEGIGARRNRHGGEGKISAKAKPATAKATRKK
jgi:hypothetical protein